MNDILKRARKEGNPIIDGKQVTFVWEGETAPYLLGCFNGWGRFGNEPATLTEIEDGIWTYTTEIAEDAYIEYNFILDPTDDETTEPDPLNPNTTPTGIDNSYNHYFNMPQAQHHTWRRRRGSKRGTVAHHIFQGWDKRHVWLYQPPTDDPVPLLLVYDGRDYYKRAKLTQIVDILIDTGKIQPIAMLMVDNAKRYRYVEYHQSDGTLDGIAGGLLPFANQHLNLLDIKKHKGAYGVLGASSGGLMALYTGIRMPNVFGKVITQSGAFGLPLATGEPMVIDVLLDYLPPNPIKIWQDCGNYDFLHKGNQTMHQKLQKQGYDVTYRAYNGGHNYTAWRDMLPDALIALFGTADEGSAKL